MKKVTKEVQYFKTILGKGSSNLPDVVNEAEEISTSDKSEKKTHVESMHLLIERKPNLQNTQAAKKIIQFATRI